MYVVVMFDLGPSHSFVYLAFSKNFNVTLGTLDHPLEVEIDDGRMIVLTIIYKACVIKTFGVEFVIDLILILMLEIRVVVDMDCLGHNHALIDCECQQV